MRFHCRVTIIFDSKVLSTVAPIETREAPRPLPCGWMPPKINNLSRRGKIQLLPRSLGLVWKKTMMTTMMILGVEPPPVLPRPSSHRSRLLLDQGRTHTCPPGEDRRPRLLLLRIPCWISLAVLPRHLYPEAPCWILGPVLLRRPFTRTFWE